jgi:predicted NAD/FAD-dependent oxidoreductase
MSSKYHIHFLFLSRMHRPIQKWKLIDDKSKKDLGTFDWLISSDRLSAGNHRRDLAKDANLKEFKSTVQKVKNVRSLTAMIVFESPLNVNIADGISFTGKDLIYGSLGWVARDSSKPGRERIDGKECWVLQSHPEAAEDIISSLNVKGKFTNTDMVKEKAREILARDFLNAIPHLNLAAGTKEEVTIAVPEVVASIGHRWGAAFPIVPSDHMLMEVESQCIPSKRFVACGDYFGKLSGRIEGAFLSGSSAADRLYNEIQQ